MARIYSESETWLMDASYELCEWIEDAGGNFIPRDEYSITVGWPKGARGGKTKRIGEAWVREASAAGKATVFLSPELADPVQVLSTLLHEMIHVSDNGASGHKGYFKSTAKAVGLEGKMTATVAGELLTQRLTELAARFGEYPHAALNGDVGGKKKQKTRMLKAGCDDCGGVCRASATAAELMFPTKCKCGGTIDLVE